MSFPVFPRLLSPGDSVRVIAPSLSLGVVPDHVVAHANRVLEGLGLQSSSSTYLYEFDLDTLGSLPLEYRVADFHEAFADDSVDGVFALLGGSTANELLPHLDFELVAAHPKVFCGFSDITVLNNALLAGANLVSFSGPHWTSFGMRDYAQQTLDWFVDAVMRPGPVRVEPSSWFTDDDWFRDQGQRRLFETEGWWVLRPGTAVGRAVGGNLGSLALLQGTPWMPSLEGAVLFVEEAAWLDIGSLRRQLFSLLAQPGARNLAALVLGRMQVACGIDRGLLEELVEVLPLPAGVPVLANVDFGHTNPLLTFPVGGRVEVVAQEGAPALAFEGG